MRKIGLILKNTLFAMTQEEFNKLLFDIKLKNPDLIVPNAIWSISESKEPDSIHVNVALICKIADGNKENFFFTYCRKLFIIVIVKICGGNG